MESPLRIAIARDADVPALRWLINESYRELADMGLNFTGATQDEEKTRERLSVGRAFVLWEASEPLGTIHVRPERDESGVEIAYFGQIAIANARKRGGLGSLLLDFAERYSVSEGWSRARLDTAKPAAHLVRWYESRGYRIAGETRFEGKTYESWIFEKTLAPNASRAATLSRP